MEEKIGGKGAYIQDKNKDYILQEDLVKEGEDILINISSFLKEISENKTFLDK